MMTFFGIKLDKLKISIKMIACFSLMLFSTETLAAAFQAFAGINYSNPAELAITVKDIQAILGDLYASPYVMFNGVVFVPDPTHRHNVIDRGQASNQGNNNLPYGRIAKRLSDQWVFGLDVSEPFISNVEYANNSILRYSITATKAYSTDIAPNLAYQFKGKLSNLSLGGGIDILRFSADLTQLLPSLPSRRPPRLFGKGPDIFVSNIASGWSYGFHLGAIYHLFKGTFLSLSYFSAFNPKLSGVSSASGFPTSYNAFTTIHLPSTTNLGIKQYLSEKWTLSAVVRYIHWRCLQQIALQNTAGPKSTLLLNFNYRNTWRVDVVTRYNVMPQVYLGGFLGYDETPTNNVDRTPGLPELNRIIVGVLGDYDITKQVNAGVSIGYIFFNGKVPINNINPNNFARTVGKADVWAPIYQLQLTMNV